MYKAIVEEGSSSMEREIAAVVFNLLMVAIKIVGSERLLRGYDVNKLQRKITASSFLPQGSLLAVIKEDGNERLLLAVEG
ncbi:hypothetical protein GW17_00053955 [Ensete ventricosum]|nr:hypothetical protein GW17_00053955 [Ensete ventricosum]